MRYFPRSSSNLLISDPSDRSDYSIQAALRMSPRCSLIARVFCTQQFSGALRGSARCIVYPQVSARVLGKQAGSCLSELLNLNKHSLRLSPTSYILRYGVNMMGSQPRPKDRVWSFAHVAQIQRATHDRSHSCDRMVPLGDMHRMTQHILGQIQ